MIKEGINQLKTQGLEGLQTALKGINQILGGIFIAISQVFGVNQQTLINFKTKIIDLGKELIEVFQFITDGEKVGEWVATNLVTGIRNIKNAILDLPNTIKAIGSQVTSQTMTWYKSIKESIALLVTDFDNGIIQIKERLLKFFTDNHKAFVTAIKTLPVSLRVVFDNIKQYLPGRLDEILHTITAMIYGQMYAVAKWVMDFVSGFTKVLIKELGLEDGVDQLKEKIIKSLKDGFNNLINLPQSIREQWGGLINWFDKQLTLLGYKVLDVVNWIDKSIVKLGFSFVDISDNFTKSWDDVSDYIQGVWTGLVNWFDTKKTLLLYSLLAIGDQLIDVLNNPTERIKDAWNGFSVWFEAKVGWLVRPAIKAATGLINALNHNPTEIIPLAWEKAGDRIIAILSNLPAIAGKLIQRLINSFNLEQQIIIPFQNHLFNLQMYIQGIIKF